MRGSFKRESSVVSNFSQFGIAWLWGFGKCPYLIIIMLNDTMTFKNEA